MNNRRLLGIVSVCLLLAGSAYAQVSKQGRLRAGAAKVDITPKESDLAVATDTIRDPLFVRAIVVDNGNACAVLVGLDMGGTGNDVMADALPKAVAATKCPAENFIISATHTHSSNTLGLGGRGAPAPKTVADAIVSAVTTARSGLAPAKVGYGTTKVDLNVNRDLFNSKLEWRQQPNPDGPSDKTLSVVEFIGENYIPIGVYMNYAMHPINFYLRGVISADFPGEASRYIEDLFGNGAVAIFSQGPSGDQNPRLSERGQKTIGAPAAAGGRAAGGGTSPQGFNPTAAQAARKAIPADELPAYKEGIARTGAAVVMMGTLIGESAIHVMRDQIQPVDTAMLWGGQEKFTCPGRERLDAANPARENVFPGYKEGPDVNLMVGLLRIGDINLATVNGEVYTNIGLKLKADSPASKTVVVTLANGAANSGYIYSDDAYSHLTFQVIGSRLQPGCAEGKIVSTAVELMHRSGE
jgi:neutral ceramidase